MKKTLSILITMLLAVSFVTSAFPAGAADIVEAYESSFMTDKTESSFYAYPDDKITGFEIVTPPDKKNYNSVFDKTIEQIYDESSGEAIEFEAYEVDFKGMVFKVYYTDGTTQTYNYNSGPIIISGITYDFEKQYQNPWVEGSNTVTVTLGSFSDTFTVNLEVCTLQDAEIIKYPDIRSSVAYGYGYYEANISDEFFYYYYPLDGMVIELTASNGEKRSFAYEENNPIINEGLECYEDQYENHWTPGSTHPITIYFSSLDKTLGSYDFTVENKYITSYEMINYAEYALSYPDISESGYYSIDFKPGALAIRVSYSDGTSSDVTYTDIISLSGDGRYFAGDFIHESNDSEDICYCIYRPIDPDGYLDEGAVYRPFNTVHGAAKSIEIINPPANLTRIDLGGLDELGVELSGLDGLGMDLTGLTAKITMTDGRVLTWRYDDSFEDGEGFFENALLKISYNYGDSLVLSYMGQIAEITPTETKYIYDYVYEEMNENCTVNIDTTGAEHYNIYKFTAWDDGEYIFNTDGNVMTTIVCGFDNEGNMIPDHFYFPMNNDYTDISFTIDCKKGDVYYFAVEGVDIGTENPEISFSVYHEMSFIKGDANGDGNVDMKDAILLRKYMLGIADEGEINLEAAIVSGGDHVSMKDVLLIRQFTLGIIEEL